MRLDRVSHSGKRGSWLAFVALAIVAASISGLSAQSIDLSQWTFHTEAAQPGVFGPLYPGDADVVGSQTPDEDGDGSMKDLVVDLGDYTGDSYTFFQSPLGLIPYSEAGTYRITWRVCSENPSVFTDPTFRLRHMYGAYGGLGNGVQQVTPGVAPTTSDGRNFSHIFDLLDVSTATAAVGSPEVEENAVTLYFDVIDLVAGVSGSLELESVTIQQLNREAILAGGQLERLVDDEWCSPELVGRTGPFNTGAGDPIVVPPPSCDYALIVSPGPVAPTLTPNQYGLSPNYLNFNGVGLVPFTFTPSAVKLDFFRAEFDLDFSGSTEAQPIAQTSLAMAFFNGGMGQTLSCETNINLRRTGNLGRNPALDSTLFSAYLAVPDGMSLGPSSTLGELIGANVRQIDTNNAGGILTVNSIRIDSFPEGLLP